jgi:hypothetical protein
MERTQGDADLGVSARAGSGALGGLGDLGNLGDLEDLLGGRSPEELQGLIDQLLGGADPGAA